jgi:hypothetical protein
VFMLRRASETLMAGYVSWHTSLCWDVAHTISSQMVWVKYTTSAECKTIRIAASAVMDGWIGCTWPLSGFSLKIVYKGDLTMTL